MFLFLYVNNRKSIAYKIINFDAKVNWHLPVSVNDFFELFYKKHQPSLVHYANYLVFSEQDALEIFNDVFVEVWRKREKLSLNDGLKPYLYRSVKNRCINFIRKNKISTLQILDVDKESGQFTDDILNAKETQQKINLVLNSLPPRCKQVFMMSRVDELSYKQIAEFLDISTKTVENQISKALKVFKENFNLQ